jgi:hypothetical protein
MYSIEAETELERRVLQDPRWTRGAAWGRPRPGGHPEGSVGAHVAQVLKNLDAAALDPASRRKLRLVALFHDIAKADVDRKRPRSGSNHHAARARVFASDYVQDLDVLELIELHDEAYNAWGAGARRGDWTAATARARRLTARLGNRLPLYLAFYRADNDAPGKTQASLSWFERLCATSTSRPR